MSIRHPATASLVVAFVALAVAACGTTTPASPSPTGHPADTRPFGVVICSIDLGDGPASPGPAPSLPVDAALDLLPPGSAVYVVAPLPAWNAAPLFVVAPAGGSCQLSVGTGWFVTLRDAQRTTLLTYESGGGVNPIACRGSRYLDVVRDACEAALGASLRPDLASPGPAERVALFAGPSDTRDALVRSGLGDLPQALYAAKGAGRDIDTWRATCEPPLGRAACGASFALLVGGATGRAVAAAVLAP